MSDGPFYTATHEPTVIKWRPVTRRKTIPSDLGPIVVLPGVHVELWNENTGISWAVRAEIFTTLYKLTGEALEVFKRHYPKVKV